MVVAGILAVVPLPAHADALRCGRTWVRGGASIRDVLARCGPPDEREWQQQIQWAHAGDAWVPSIVLVERWWYDLGPNQFVRTLTFRNGVLDDVSLAGYGER